MPQIIVTADDATDRGGSVMLREKVNVADFESDRFATNLVERLGWAVSDAAEAECDTPAEPEHEADAESVNGDGVHAADRRAPQPV